MTRREVIALLAGAAVPTGWPLRAGAQSTTTPVIGYLANASPGGFAHFVAAFRRGLAEAGYVEGQNVTIEYRWAQDGHDLPAMAAELAEQQVALIVATGGFAPARAAKAVTKVIPIVFTGGDDPVKAGLVESLAKPGGNATGVVNVSTEVTAKRFELLRELVPAAGPIGVLVNSASPDAQAKEIERTATAVGQAVFFVSVKSEAEFEGAFADLRRQGAGALFVTGDPLFTSRRESLLRLAATHRLPASYSFRDFPLAGGLMSYGVDLLDVHRQAGAYAGRILNGAKPMDLPILQASRFQLTLNLKTARALGLAVPTSLLARADEVIE